MSKHMKFQNPALAGSAAGSMIKTSDKQPVTEQKKCGRKKQFTEERKRVLLQIPVSSIEKWDSIKEIYGSNFNAYVTKLIQKDLDENYNNYKAIIDNLKNI